MHSSLRRWVVEDPKVETARQQAGGGGRIQLAGHSLSRLGGSHMVRSTPVLAAASHDGTRLADQVGETEPRCSSREVSRVVAEVHGHPVLRQTVSGILLALLVRSPDVETAAVH